MNRLIAYITLTCLSFTQISCVSQNTVAPENLLYPSGIEDNPITYDQQNLMRDENCSHPDAPLSTCRVYSNVATPTYYIYQADPANNTAVAIVVLPGGGYTDIWLDKEGHNIALFFKERGITSLVLKYRTNTNRKDGKPQMTQEKYVPFAVEDAKEALRILRSKATQLNIDPARIGLGGFSAGGHLTLSLCLDPAQKDQQAYPDFTFLIYPWIQPHLQKQTETAKDLPPMFIVNGQEDTVTPPDVCARFYDTLCKNNVPAELHIYAKGRHGFSLALGNGHSTVQWTDSFIQWLKDIDMIND